MTGSRWGGVARGGRGWHGAAMAAARLRQRVGARAGQTGWAPRDPISRPARPRRSLRTPFGAKHMARSTCDHLFSVQRDALRSGRMRGRRGKEGALSTPPAGQRASPPRPARLSSQDVTLPSNLRTSSSSTRPSRRRGSGGEGGAAVRRCHAQSAWPRRPRRPCWPRRQRDKVIGGQDPRSQPVGALNPSRTDGPDVSPGCGGLRPAAGHEVPDAPEANPDVRTGTW